jgi:hypothetical protein
MSKVQGRQGEFRNDTGETSNGEAGLIRRNSPKISPPLNNIQHIKPNAVRGNTSRARLERDG